MDPAKAAALALDPSTPVDQLAALTRLGLTFLVEHVARNPNVTPDLLREITPGNISSDSGLRVAMAIAESKKAPDAALLKLLDLVLQKDLDGSRRENGEYERLAAKILTHPNCPTETVLATLGTAKLSKALHLAVTQATSGRM